MRTKASFERSVAVNSILPFPEEQDNWRIAVREPCYFGQELGYPLPTRQEYNIVAKPVSLFEEWRTLLKSKGRKKSKLQQAKEEAFTEKLKDLFDMAHQN